jgi:hypothetical protein
MSHLRALSALLSIASVAIAGAAVAPTSVAAPAKPCTAVAKGVLWTFQGQTGVAYRIVGVNGGSCPLAVSWLVRLTKQKGPLVKGPKGWTCSAKRPSGSCANARGAVLTWSPKLRPR